MCVVRTGYGRTACSLVSCRLQTVRDALAKKEHPTVEVCYFVPDTRKAGGAYCTVTGVVKKMAEFEGLLIMADGTEVPMGEISVLELHG